MARDLRAEYGFLDKFRGWFGKQSIIVLTMGKVGTLTICNSLENIGLKHVHPHSLYYTRPGVHFIYVPLSLSRKIWYGYKTATKRIKVLIWSKLSREIVIVTGIRDPFSRAISAYFEQIHYCGGIPEAWEYENIRQDFQKRAFIQATTSWFDDEIMRFTGIDILDRNFDVTKGCLLVRRKKFRVFVYRVDKLSNLEAELADFLEREDFRIVNANETSDGIYADKYDEFRKRYKYDHDIVDHLLETRYMRAFFTREEALSLRQQWSKTPSTESRILTC